jgi:hypothetical protein
MPSAEAEISIPAAPETVWKVAGPFTGVADWHPAVGRVAKEADGKQRRLHLLDGAEIVEALLQHDESARAYSYRIVDAPLPVENYQALFHVDEDGAGGTIVRWTARFDVTGEEDSESVERTVQGIFESGLEHLKQLTAA